MIVNSMNVDIEFITFVDDKPSSGRGASIGLHDPRSITTENRVVLLSLVHVH